MPILRIENPRAMLTAANIRLESGCEDKYLSLHRPPPNPYLLGGVVGKIITFYQSQETNICYCREQLCSKSILLRSKKENNTYALPNVNTVDMQVFGFTSRSNLFNNFFPFGQKPIFFLHYVKKI